MKKVSLLIIEDEEAIRDLLRFSLPEKEFELTDAINVSQATRILAERLPELIILDWMLPDKSGIDFIKWIKQKDALKDIPIIMLTAKAEEEQKIQGLMTGADDYVTKPFSIAELTARIRTILRRGLLTSPENEIHVGDLSLNTIKHTVTVNNEKLQLTPLEYRLLHFLVTHPNKVYSRDWLINHIWGGNTYIEDRTVDVQIKRLRAKLKNSNCRDLLKTIRGAGYIFSSEDHEKKK